MKAQLGVHRDGTNTDAPPEGPTLSLHRMYAELDFFGQSLATRFGTGTPTAPPPDCTRRAAPRAACKMPQLAVSSTGSPRNDDAVTAQLPRRPRGALQLHVPDVFPKYRLPCFSFVLAGRQAGWRCQGRRFQTSFPQRHGLGRGCRYTQKLLVIGHAAVAEGRVLTAAAARIASITRSSASLAEIPPNAVADPLVNKSSPPMAPRARHRVRPVTSRHGCP